MVQSVVGRLLSLLILSVVHLLYLESSYSYLGIVLVSKRSLVFESFTLP